MEKANCHISKTIFPISQLQRGDSLRKELVELIRQDFPDFKEDSYISAQQLNEYRRKYMQNMLRDEDLEISELQKEVIESIGTDKLLTKNTEEVFDESSTLGEQVADKVAEFGGSWFFIIFFFTFILFWIILNAVVLLQKAYDPYPFILLNLILSCLAAIQAPIIMMSQNRLETKDRKRAESDYKVNLKAELEIKLLHEKIDHMIQHQNKRLLEIQELQTEYLNDILKSVEKKEK